MAIHEEDSAVENKPEAQAEDQSVFDNVLRPQSFDDYIGQSQIKQNLQTFIQAAKSRGETLDHTLFYGPPGLGKTTLSMILAHQMESNLKITSGPALEKPGDLAAILSNLAAGDFLFIDEIHRLRRPIEEILYTAMEDFAIDIVMGNGPSARTMRLSIPRFTLIGATTQASLLAGPLRDRFGHTEKMRFYDESELGKIIENSTHKLEYKIDPEAALLLARASRGTPRIANRLLRRMRDFAQVAQLPAINTDTVTTGLTKLAIDPNGLDYADQEYLRVLCDVFKGGPVGISTIASALGEEVATIEDVIEPFLIREGFLQKTPRGRTATDKAFGRIQGGLFGA